MQDMLPRLFFQNFATTSLVAEDTDGRLAGFIVAFPSQDQPEQGYIHFVGVEPGHRRQGVGRQLYERTFASLQARGCTSVKSVTSPVNSASIAFHERMGFGKVAAPGSSSDEVWLDYDGPGEHRVVFVRPIN